MIFKILDGRILLVHLDYICDLDARMLGEGLCLPPQLLQQEEGPAFPISWNFPQVGKVFRSWVAKL